MGHLQQDSDVALAIQQGVADLVNYGIAGAVIVVVVVFLRYLAERDRENRETFREIVKQNADAVANLGKRVDENTKLDRQIHETNMREHATIMATQRVLLEKAGAKVPESEDASR